MWEVGVSLALSNKKIVIKYGGSTLNDEAQRQILFEEIAQLHSLGNKIVLVHGGGPQISHMLSRLQIESKHIDGLRIVDKETIEVAEMVLCGNINKALVSCLQSFNVNALGLCGKDLNLFTVKPQTGFSVNLGYFGQVDSINKDQIDFLLSHNLIPVIAPIGLDSSGATFMLDADHVSAQLASAINADKLFILTNVPGVLKETAAGKVTIGNLSAYEAEKLLQDGQISGGMIPKLQSCIQAVQAGVPQVYVFNGETPKSLLTNACDTEAIGTVLQPV